MPTSFEKELKSFMAARMEQNTTVHRLSSGEFPKPGSGEFEEFVGFLSGRQADQRAPGLVKPAHECSRA